MNLKISAHSELSFVTDIILSLFFLCVFVIYILCD